MTRSNGKNPNKKTKKTKAAMNTTNALYKKEWKMISRYERLNPIESRN